MKDKKTKRPERTKTAKSHDPTVSKEGNDAVQLSGTRLLSAPILILIGRYSKKKGGGERERKKRRRKVGGNGDYGK